MIKEAKNKKEPDNRARKREELAMMEKVRKQEEMDVMEEQKMVMSEKTELLDVIKKAEKQKLAVMDKAKTQEFRGNVFNGQKQNKMYN